MKKNLTFLMMLMAFVGIAFAQQPGETVDNIPVPGGNTSQDPLISDDQPTVGPTFNYQAVVRHHDAETNQDTLYYNQEVNVVITITDGDGEPQYQEYHNGLRTDANGLVHVVIGEGEDHPMSLLNVDWSDANIVATITLVEVEETLDPITMHVTPVPYALQAGVTPLTTERIAAYAKNVNSDPTMLTKDGAKQVLNAFVNNLNGLEEALEDAIEDSVESNHGYEIALSIIVAYMQQLSVSQVAELQDYYDAVRANSVITEEMKELVKEFVKNPDNREMVKNWVKPVVLFCLQNTTKQDVKDFYHALQQIPADEKENIKSAVIEYLQAYIHDTDKPYDKVIDYYLNDIVNEINDAVSSISYDEVLYAWGWLEMYRNDDLKPVLRNKLDYYIGQYRDNLLAAKVSSALDVTNQNGYASKLIKVPTCTDFVGYCQLEQLYNQHNQ